MRDLKDGTTCASCPEIISHPATPEYEKTYTSIFGERKPAYLKTVEEINGTEPTER